ncbi:MAG: hypothetical protein Q9227_001801 [Pyrenula ochraceoflavens]
MPIFSAACYACRNRRIKCDLRRPGCRRCSTYGIICPGYRIPEAGALNIVFYQPPKKDVVGQSSDAPTTELPTTRTNKQISQSHNKATSPLFAISNATIYRTGVLGVFVDAVFAGGARSYTTVSRIIHEKYAFLSRSRAMMTCLNAVGMLQLATTSQDRRIQLAGQSAHVTGLRMLRSELSQPEGIMQSVPCAIQAVAQQLLFCEVYGAVAGGEGAWEKHVSGISEMIVRRLRSRMRPTDDYFENFLIKEAQLLSLVHSLVVRKRSPFSALERQVLKGKRPGDTDTLVQLALRLPALLEKSDAALHPGMEYIGQAAQTKRLLLQLESDLRQWMYDYYQRTGRTPLLAHGIIDMCLSSNSAGAAAAALTTRLQSFLDALHHALFWICLILLRESLLDLQENNEQVRSSFHLANDSFGTSGNDAAKLDMSNQAITFARVDHCAYLLCASVSFLDSTAEGSMSRVMAVRAPLYFASRWFERSGQTEMLQDCQTHEEKTRKEFQHLNWDALLVWSFFSLAWLTT